MEAAGPLNQKFCRLKFVKLLLDYQCPFEEGSTPRGTQLHFQGQFLSRGFLPV